MSKFKAGDRVISIKPVGIGERNKGIEGTILCVRNTRDILVEFDTDIHGHNGLIYINGGKICGQEGHCWWCADNMIEKLNKQKGEFKKMEFEEDKEYVCDCCGCKIDKDYGDIFEYCGETRVMCHDCYSENFSICKICGDIIHNDDAEYIDDYGEACCCESCFRRDYARCFDCGEIIDMRNDNYYYCASRYGNCDEVVCTSCREDHWSYCDDCEALFYDDDLSYHEYDDCHYCDNCYDCHCRGDYDGINEYHEGPMLVYYDKDGTMEDQTGTDFKGYGFELEVDCGGYDHDNAAKVCDMLDKEVYCCSDGSINDGFEIISHPHTREALEKMQMDDVLDWLRQRGYRSHDAETCGLHLHASKLLFGDEEKDRIRNISKIVMFYEIFWDDILKISRRTEERANRWARKYSKGKKDTYEMVDTAIKSGYCCNGRYFAVNLCNRHTVEFRIMRGTLKKETFWATLDFLMTTVENAKWIPFAKINKPELWLRHMKPETLDYIRSRGAFASVVGQSNTVEENNEEE